ncbi:hypothetical protein SOVF_089790 [Spinacia oleracea]|nr:hypothetical protein SOVF_089790 [Spinacia oleracea]
MAKQISWFSVFFSIYLPFILLLIPKSTNGQNPYAICPNTTIFANNSQYQANLDTVFRYLSSNATNPNGYHQAVSGNGNAGSEAVYGHFLCRGDLDTISCQNCVTTATTTGLPRTLCPNRKVAIIWYDDCLVRYSNQSFFGRMETVTGIILVNINNVTGNTTRFEEVMGNMMNNVIAVQAPNGGQQKKFATDVVNFTTFQTIYGLGQCTPDLSPSDCNTCLMSGIGHFGIAMGAQSLLSSCVVRYENYPFFNLSSVVRPPQPRPLSPPQSPTSNSVRSNGKRISANVIIAIVIPIVAIIVALLVICIYCAKYKKTKKYDTAETGKLVIFPIYRQTKMKKKYCTFMANLYFVYVFFGYDDIEGEGFTTVESLQFDLATLQSATNKFSIDDKLGEGGFGGVYKVRFA